MHWRDKRRATDLEQPQGAGAALGTPTVPCCRGPRDDIVEVTRYLNQSIYRFSPPTVQSSVDPQRIEPHRAGNLPRPTSPAH